MTGRTRVAGVIGDPVRHSLSPAMHNAAFEAAGLDWVYVAFEVPRGSGGAAVMAMRDLAIAGLNVTMPHKADAASACDELSDAAARLRSVNTVLRRGDGTLYGDSTDGEGLVRSLVEEEVALEGRSVLVIGAGGAARAIVPSLDRAGARVTVSARRSEPADEVAALTGGATAAYERMADAVAGVDIVVNATPLGMQGEPPPFDADRLEPRHTVVDLVYDPAQTPLLEAAAARGCRAVGGLGMLVHQGALAFTLWTGEDAPLDAMRAAASRALAERS